MPANSVPVLQRYLASYVKVGVLEKAFLGHQDSFSPTNTLFY